MSKEEWEEELIKILVRAPYDWTNEEAEKVVRTGLYDRYFEEGWCPVETLWDDNKHWGKD